MKDRRGQQRHQHAAGDPADQHDDGMRDAVPVEVHDSPDGLGARAVGQEAADRARQNGGSTEGW
jgi:hypothetical protein